MKKYFFKLLIIVVAGSFAAGCGNDNNSEKTNKDTAKAATDVNIAPNPTSTLEDSNSNKMDASIAPATVPDEFVNNAVKGGMMEVTLGKLAQANSSNDDIKEYGRMLERDHEAANNQLKAVAQAEHIAIPVAMADEQNMHINHLQNLKGIEFDKAFIAMMVDDHSKNIDEFKKAAKANSNEKIKDFAAKTLPTLQTHLNKAITLKNKIK